MQFTIYDHVTMGNSLSVHSDLQGQSVRPCTMFINEGEGVMGADGPPSG